MTSQPDLHHRPTRWPTDRGEAHVEQASDFLADRAEDLAGLDALLHEHRNAAQRGLFVGEELEAFMTVRARSRDVNKLVGALEPRLGTWRHPR
jgi:hypothetical protein